jgi:sigma-B regulation protein RsbU (phosphoserine phosphatase)
LAVIILLSGGFFFSTRFFIAGRMTRENIRVAKQRLKNFARTNFALTEKVMSEAAALLVENRAYGAAFELAYLLRGESSPYDYRKLRADEVCRTVATHNITVSNITLGYISVFDTNGIAVWHPDPAVEGQNYQAWADEFPQMWALCRQAFTQQNARGVCTFLDTGTREPIEKFVVTCRVSNTPLIVSATVNIADFYSNVHQIIRNIEATEIAQANKTISTMGTAAANAIHIVTSASLGILGVACCLLAFLLSRSISSPVSSLQRAVQQLGSGDFATKVPEAGPPEIISLARSFNRLEEQLQVYMDNLKRETAAREVFETEVKITRDIQLSLIPRTFPPFPERKEFTLYATLQPAKQVAGDFYDFFFINDDTLVFLIGDVSGKSVPAAFFMAVTRTLLRSACNQFGDPARVLTLANSILAEGNDACMFVTLFIGYYLVKTGEITYANAGHHPAVLLESNGSVCTFGLCEDPPLGIVDDNIYRSGHTILSPGNTVMLYTDGVTEAHAPGGELYGDDRLMVFLKQHGSDALEDVSTRLLEELDDYQNGMVFDDITLLLLHRCISEHMFSCGNNNGT